LISEPPQVTAFREKMETTAAKQAYQNRGPVAEFPNAWIKEKFLCPQGTVGHQIAKLANRLPIFC
jgi:hypothetical protein